LPFLESGWVEEDPAGEVEDEEADNHNVYLNMGQEGITYKGTGVDVSESSEGTSERRQGDDADGVPSAGDSDENFAARRLSVHNPFDEDWNEVGEDEAGDDDEAGGAK